MGRERLWRLAKGDSSLGPYTEHSKNSMPPSWNEHRGYSTSKRTLVSSGSEGLSRDAWSTACCWKPLRVCSCLPCLRCDAGTQLLLVSHSGWHVGFLFSQRKVHFREGSGRRQTVGCSTWDPSVPIRGQLELMQACHPNVIKCLLLPDDVLFSGGLVGGVVNLRCLL